MKKFSLVSITILLTLVLYQNSLSEENSTKTEEDSQIIKKISVKEAHKMISENKSNTYLVVLDVRTPEEFTSGHLNNAQNIDYNSEAFRDEVNKLDKSKTYIIHCRSGGRSAKALEIMKNLNFKEVYDMGGILQWQEKKYEITKWKSDCKIWINTFESLYYILKASKLNEPHWWT